MMNNEPNRVVTRQQSLKQQQLLNAVNESETEAIVDSNNNDKAFKDRNVPFAFDPSSKFTYLTSENASDQENDQENTHATHKRTNNDKKVPHSVLKPLNITNSNGDAKLASHYYSHGSSGAIKRGCEDVENENEDDLVTSISSSTSGCSRRSPPKKPKFVVTSEEMNEYFNLLHQNDIQLFLERDACCLISDKYALAMVFTYFKRAKFNLQEYTKDHFYLALYLASDIEEDVDEYKYEIFPWALGTSWRSEFSGFLRRRDELLRRIGYRAIVSRKCCEEVMSFKAEHRMWKRERAQDHGGATRAYLINRSKKFLLSKSNLEDDELNLPRLPEESPRPCSLCLINRGWNSVTNSINKPETKPISPTKSASSNSSKSEPQVSCIKSYNTVIKRQKNNDYSAAAEKVLNTAAKTTTTGNLNNKAKSEVKLTQNDQSNSETESESAVNNGKVSKMPPADKFLKVKLSTTELELHHRGYSQQHHTNELSSNTENTNFSFINLQRRSSLASSDKFLLKDSFNTSEEDEDDETDSNSEVDDVFANEKNTANKLLVKKQEIIRVNGAKLRGQNGRVVQMPSGPNAVKRRTNYSLSNTSNYNLRSHSVNAQKKVYPAGAMFQLVPKD